MTWVTVLGSAAPYVAAAAILVVGWISMRQKQRNDRRDQWWKRVQWAADLILSAGEPERIVGMAALVAIIHQADQLDGGDAALLQAIIDVVGPRHGEDATAADGISGREAH